MILSRARVAVVALASAALLAACTGGGSGQSGNSSSSSGGGGFGTLPAASGTPRDGGTVNVAESPGAGPNYIFPVTPAANGSVYNAYQFQQIMWRPLYFSPTGTQPKVDMSNSIAESEPQFSDGNKTVTIHMKKNYTWSDGKPVVANDVIFFVDLVKAAIKEDASNFSNYTPGFFPDSVTSITAPDQYTVKMTLNKAFNPQFFYLNQAALLIPLPSTAWNKSSANGSPVDFTNPAGAKAIYDFLAGEAKKLTTYATNPIWQTVDGAYHLTKYDANTNALTMEANPKYTGKQKPHIKTLNFVAFTSNTALFNQLRSGTLDVGQVDFTELPQVPLLKRQGYNVYGYPSFGFNYIVYNFKDQTGHFDKIIGQLYIRQALAHLQNEPAVIRGAFKNAAAPAYGPVPPMPKSPFTPPNATKNPYPYDVNAAKKLLTDHGWNVVPGGQSTCKNAGSGANQCGAGIPAGTPLKWNLYYGNQPAAIGQQVTALVSAAKQLGITISTSQKTFNYLITNFSDASAKSTINQWAMMDFGGFSISLEPTTNQIFNTEGSYNIGGFHDPKADELINNSVFGNDPQAVSKEAQYLTQQLPGMFQPNPDLVFAWKNTLSGPPDSFAVLTQYYITPEYWYFKK
jgi:peptide/nickel transport system substrate-binding protein